MAKSDYAVKQSLTKEGYEVYNEVLNKLQDGSDKSKLAANENAFIYARMAESWARIRNEYGDTTYTAKDFMAEHAVMANKGQTSGTSQQVLTQKEINTARTELVEDKKAWRHTVNRMPSNNDKDIVEAMRTPIVLRIIGAKPDKIAISVGKVRKIQKEHPEVS